ncbi:hypothetical protein [Chromobacterium haemolyticum]|uniref:hypothetical protein n=1 Tax=Chromobacterium haemolyticum TaxID=394935 RepID=UPI000DEF7D8D|nr:hypothetical protein [Chromobacterium haemolyticum]
MLSSKGVVCAATTFTIFCAGLAKSEGSLAHGQFILKGAIEPAACVVDFYGKEIQDFGVFDSKILQDGNGDFLERKGDVMPFKVRCDAVQQMSVRFVDNNPGSVHGDGHKDRFGLGFIGDAKVGYFRFTVSNDHNKVIIDEEEGSVKADYARSETKEAGSWKREPNADKVFSGYYYTPMAVNDATATPLGFKEWHSAVKPTIFIDRKLVVTDKAEFEGVATLELHYL